MGACRSPLVALLNWSRVKSWLGLRRNFPTQVKSSQVKSSQVKSSQVVGLRFKVQRQELHCNHWCSLTLSLICIFWHHKTWTFKSHFKWNCIGKVCHYKHYFITIYNAFDWIIDRTLLHLRLNFSSGFLPFSLRCSYLKYLILLFWRLKLVNGPRGLDHLPGQNHCQYIYFMHTGRF